MIEFTVPGQPVPKGRPRMTKSGHAYTPQRTRDYESRVRLCAGAAMRGRPPLDDDAHVFIRCYFSDRRRRDIDNSAKALLDAMNGIVYSDDSIVSILRIERSYDKQNPRAEVRVGWDAGRGRW